MPTPAYIDLSLYLPAGGVNGFELNGFAVNGVGFVDSPFAGSTFALDPYRSILEGEPQATDLRAIYASLLPTQPDLSVQVGETREASLWPPAILAEVDCERRDSSVPIEVVSATNAVESVSLVPAEYRTAYVLADHPSTTTSDRKDSDVDQLPVSTEPSEVEISVVPPEYRTVKVRRGDS